MDMLCVILVWVGLISFIIWAMACPTAKPVVQSVPPSQVPTKIEPEQPIEATIPAEVDIWAFMREHSIKLRKQIALEKQQKSASKPKWFICEWVKTLKISPAEQLIIDQLSRYRVEWHREVSFNTMPLTPKGSTYRYDFYLPQHNTIIEYQGKHWHVSEERLAADKVKAAFCKKHSIDLIIWSGEHYYHIEHHVRVLMGKLGVSLLPIKSPF